MDRLDQMEAFIRVVDTGSFTAAARQWGRSKAVVSKYINALEAHLGVELLPHGRCRGVSLLRPLLDGTLDQSREGRVCDRFGQLMLP